MVICKKYENSFCFLSFLSLSSPRQTTKCVFIMEEVKKRIVSGAAQLFMRHGAKSITMDDVAKDSGISKRTLYEYFADKDSLLIACIEMFVEFKRAEHQEFLNTSENVIEAILKSVKRSLEFQDISPVFFMEVKRFYPAVAKTHLSCTEDMRYEDTMNFLKMGIKQGIFRKNLNLEIITHILMNQEASIGEAATEIIYNKKFDLKEYFLTTVFCLIRGLATEKGIELIEKYEKKEKL